MSGSALGLLPHFLKADFDSLKILSCLKNVQSYECSLWGRGIYTPYLAHKGSH
jgi:hypothetical protein